MPVAGSALAQQPELEATKQLGARHRRVGAQKTAWERGRSKSSLEALRRAWNDLYQSRTFGSDLERSGAIWNDLVRSEAFGGDLELSAPIWKDQTRSSVIWYHLARRGNDLERLGAVLIDQGRLGTLWNDMERSGAISRDLEGS